MYRKWKTLIFTGTSLVVACAASAFLLSRASPHPPVVANLGTTQTQARPRTKNLRLQPEAASVNRRLGNRFTLSGQAESIISGALTLAGNQKLATIIRRQTESGEFVEVLLAGRRLTWSNAEGIKTTGGSVTEPERLLIERLIFDSPDQFVLAQLRGASYYTITRNLRPPDAGENYSGSLWRLVRISEPQGFDEVTPKSRWRLYYINEVTELIDRVVCELDGQQIEASIRWTANNGEQIASNTKWTRNGQTIMEFDVTAFSQQR
jgi:hypothetical protein